jgi:hypothetical protein
VIFFKRDKKEIILYLPLILSELYLLLTLVLCFYGPIIWPIENLGEFLFLIFSYHLAFISGYVVFLKLSPRGVAEDDSFIMDDKFRKQYYTIVSLALVAALISHRNIVHTSSYIPFDFFSDLKRGLLNPFAVRGYYASSEYLERFQGNKLVTSMLFFLSVFKYSLLPCLIYFWDKLRLIDRFLGITVVCVPIATGISISISAINFSYLFIISICLGLLVLQRQSLYILKERLFFIFFFLVLLLFSVLNFYEVKSGVSLMAVASGKAVPQRFDYLREKGIVFKSDKEKQDISAATDIYEKITVYLVNGYLGMSISLGEEFQTTYGLGHSEFLQRVADGFGLGIGNRTFQNKITVRWDKNVMWNSAYSHFANDVGYYGVIVVMFVLGFFLSMVYSSAVESNNLVGYLLVPLFGIFVLYIPANNQIFSFLETMSSFWLLSFLFILLFKRGRFRKKLWPPID